MDKKELNKWQEGWYEMGQKLVLSMLQPISYAINGLQIEINNKTGSADQLKFFDYIYPSISQRLGELEKQLGEIKGLLVELKMEKRITKKVKAKIKRR